MILAMGVFFPSELCRCRVCPAFQADVKDHYRHPTNNFHTYDSESDSVMVSRRFVLLMGHVLATGLVHDLLSQYGCTMLHLTKESNNVQRFFLGRLCLALAAF